MADSRARVYGWLGDVNSLSAAASSTIFPRYITAMDSATLRTRLRSCEIKRYVSRSSRCNRRSSPIIFACTDTSSAEVGSSSTISLG